MVETICAVVVLRHIGVNFLFSWRLKKFSDEGIQQGRKNKTAPGAENHHAKSVNVSLRGYATIFCLERYQTDEYEMGRHNVLTLTANERNGLPDVLSLKARQRQLLITDTRVLIGLLISYHVRVFILSTAAFFFLANDITSQVTKRR